MIPHYTILNKHTFTSKNVNYKCYTICNVQFNDLGKTNLHCILYTVIQANIHIHKNVKFVNYMCYIIYVMYKLMI